VTTATTPKPATKNVGTTSTQALRQVRKAIAESLGAKKFEVWFGRTDLALDASDQLAILTDTAFVSKWISTHYTEMLEAIARDVLGDAAIVTVRVKSASGDAAERQKPDAGSGPEDRRPARRAADPGERSVASAAADGGSRASVASRLQNLKSLEDFVVGPCNRLAYAAACRLVDEPSISGASPLFVHGECGVGKTHLLQGVCRRFVDRYGRAPRVRYVTGEQFTNDFILAIRNGELETFRRSLRRVDLLAIDDVHFLSNKSRTQSEFLCTLDAIDLAGARVVLASDEHPRHIRRFSQALVSRFMSGMVVQVDRPDRETRLAIIRSLAHERGLSIVDSAAEEIAGRCVGSIREIQGVIAKLAALLSIQHQLPLGQRAGGPGGGGEDGRTIGSLLVQQLFQDDGWQPTAPVRIQTIIDVVVDRMGIQKSDLMGSGRHRRVVLGRAIVAYLGRRMTTMSYPELARALGRSYHSTIHTAEQRLERQLEAKATIELDRGAPAVDVADFVDDVRHRIMRAAAGRSID
jgi:chromosomal replication initiator protein